MGHDAERTRNNCNMGCDGVYSSSGGESGVFKGVGVNLPQFDGHF